MRKILKSFKCALNGIIHSIKNERNMRIHTVAAVYVLIFSVFFNLSCEKYCILFLTIALVLGIEMINSSIEGLLDIYSKDYNPAVKYIKDVTAGAVLVSAGFSVAIALWLFWDFNAYFKMWAFFLQYPVMIFLFLIFSAFNIIYVYFGPSFIKRQIIKAFGRLKLKK